MEGPKVWLCLYTCCISRALHLNLVPDVSAHTFIRSFKRFSARRGIPGLMISYNAQTFKSASRIIQKVLDNPEVKAHFSKLQVKLKFNIEKAPWWDSIFKRMVRSAKCCFKKAVGRVSVTCDELLTLVIEIEAVFHSRPLSYIAMDDLEEPLTLSHLLLGYSVLSLPDPSVLWDVDHAESASDLTCRMIHLITTIERSFGDNGKGNAYSNSESFIAFVVGCL